MPTLDAAFQASTSLLLDLPSIMNDLNTCTVIPGPAAAHGSWIDLVNQNWLFNKIPR